MVLHTFCTSSTFSIKLGLLQAQLESEKNRVTYKDTILIIGQLNTLLSRNEIFYPNFRGTNIFSSYFFSCQIVLFLPLAENTEKLFQQKTFEHNHAV